MGGRSETEVKQELEHERERLGDAVHALRGQAARARQKLPLVAAALAGVGIVAGLVKRRVSKAPPEETGRRARFPFLGRE